MLLQKISPERERLIFEINKIGADPYALKMWEKGVGVCVKIKSVSYAQANIIKQEAIASGIDAVVSKGTVSGKIKETDILILGSRNGFMRLVKRLSNQPFGLKDFADNLKIFISGEKGNYIYAREKKIDLSECKIMGILNTTPDSFSDGGNYTNEKAIDVQIEKLAASSDIIDIGGESTRPGVPSVDKDEEIKRVKYAVERAVDFGDKVVSIDTTKSAVAEFALKKGVHIVNDISGLTFDKNMASICAEYGAGVCIMHINGTPETMQDNISYNNLLEDIKIFFDRQINYAIRCGISEERIMLDPGIGFGKTLEHNYIILKYLEEFKAFNLPVVIGLSRKSLIGKIDNSKVSERDMVSKVLESIAVINGADIIRTHDTESLKKVLKIIDFYSKVEIDD
ncbi:MAG: dihydropteroate synthase [Deferribacteres bacterium]|nr:dihydropteroate synthase [Deferribacteres bacterium]